MIWLGLDVAAKDREIARYRAEHGIEKVVFITPEKFDFACTAPDRDCVEWAEVIEYRTYYRLLREIDRDTLVVVNECMRTQDRHDLAYNCMRLFLNQTPHQLIFQYLPLIDKFDDFMILFDFDTKSRWKREPFRADLLRECAVRCAPATPEFREIPVEVDPKTRGRYAAEKRKLIDGIGLKDPHTIPRNLYLLSGRSKLARVEADRDYVGRNNRFKIDRFRTYRERSYPGRSTVFELCHNFIDFADFLSLSRQTDVDVLVADLKVDRWYFARYQGWAGRLHEAYAILRRQEDRA